MRWRLFSGRPACMLATISTMGSLRMGGNDRAVRRPGRGQRGNAMIVALVALTGLVGLGSLAMLSVQGGIASSGHDRFQAIALYAAESGAATALDYLRKNVMESSGWTRFVTPNNEDPQRPAEIPGNGVRPGEPDNLFSENLQAWYEIEVRNNLDDPRYADGIDSDKRILVVATGHGPNGAIAQLEWDIAAPEIQGLGRSCPAYGQKGMAEDGAGRNDCLTTIDKTVLETHRPGDAP